MAKKAKRTNWKAITDDLRHDLHLTRDQLSQAIDGASRQGRESAALTGTINDLRLRNGRGAMQLHAAAEQLATLGKTHAAALLHEQANDLAS